MDAFRRVNVAITSSVVEAALDADVRRLIYVSSIKAVGEGSAEGYTELSPCAPEDAYGQSKREAEILVHDRTANRPIEAAIVRPLVVYGPGVKGNIERMLKLVQRMPVLPIRCLRAKRSMVYVGNLVDALRCMIESQRPIGGIYHISDGDDPLTTRELLRRMARLMGRNTIEVPVPAVALRTVARLVGMSQDVDRLTRSLTTRAFRLESELGWRPRYSVQEGLTATVRWYVERQAKAAR